MTDFKNPFDDPNLTYKGKTAEQRGEELEKERRKRDLEARIAEKRNGGAEQTADAYPVPEPEPAVPPVHQTAGFKIEVLADRYRIYAVQYAGESYVVDMSKELLDNGRSHTQDEWVSMTQNEDLKLASSELYFAVLSTLYDNRNHSDTAQKTLVENVKGVLAEDFQKYYMMTSSRTKYTKKSGLLKRQKSDKITHDYGYPAKKEQDVAMVGSDGWINSSCGYDEPIDALLGIKDMDKVEKVSKWVTGKKPYLWRVNSQPANDDERAVVLGVGRFYVYAYDSIYDDGPARGWSTQRARKTP